MKSIKIGFLCIFIIPALIFCSTEKALCQDTAQITIKNLRRQMGSIASDATEGRFTGSPGYWKAAKYTANEFRKEGLKPGIANEKGNKSYFQEVPFIRDTYSKATSITLQKNGRTKIFNHSAGNFLILDPGHNYKNAPVAAPVFIGYGINEPKAGWDDYGGLDVKGKWVIMLSGIPSQDSKSKVLPKELNARYGDWDTC
jgi:hypothetical protein